ncbi:lysophospholipid acyltransferase family protein [Cumulibacter manganitolerans]|uniref:lysophospholipid acyltransferase family protein n=1 Tax=Cumulibacter manganitolerans TaxID=1884992 RepID=UPI001885DC1A|nr:lysophospholipid acyltransferase family protein [Cumulibacter manganitolerans]
MSDNLQPPVKRGRKSAGRLTPALQFLVPIVRNLSRLIFKERFEQRENIPVQGPALLVLNHVSVLDPIATAAYVWTAGRLPLFMIKDGVFKAPVVGRLFTGARQIPVSRGSAAAQESLERAIAALRAGEVVAVYPEGTVTRDPDWWPMRAKTGVARIALAVPEAKVIPIAQWGAQRAYDYHTKKMHLLPRKQTWIRALPPMDLSRYAGRTDSVAARELTDEMMRALADEVGRMRGEQPPAELHRYTGKS